MRDFHYRRWKIFFDALKTGAEVPDSHEWFRIEEAWTHENRFGKRSDENPVDVAEELFRKYFYL